MTIRKLAALASLGALALVPQLSAESLRSPEYREASFAGADYLYRLEHDEAIRYFERLEREFPEHPGPPLSRSVSIWLRELFDREELDLERFISPGYFNRPAEREMRAPDRAAFFEGLERSRELAERYLAAHPGSPEARYYLGASEGALGAFAFTIDRDYRQALGHGKTSYEIQRAILDQYPDFYDSYLTVGTYEYVVGNLPWYIKWLATIAGYRGSERRGFEYLVGAAKQGELSATDARLLLMVLYVREEQYDYALDVATQLHQRYPENFVLHLNRAQILERMGRREEAAAMLADVLDRAVQGKKNYGKIPLSQLRYALGTRFLELGRRDVALLQFQSAVGEPGATGRDQALSHLKAGQILDLLGRRDEAVSHYRAVQKLDEFEGSHASAERYLHSPYRDDE
jgi:tetratricopeptide (TPR) repeat protein